MEGGFAAPLLIVTAGALAMPWVSRKLGVPVAVAEIGYGLLVGASGLGWLDPAEPAVGVVSGLGFALFLLLAGMEIDLDGLFEGGLRAVITPAIVGASSLTLAIGASAWLHQPMWTGLAAGVIAVPLVLAVLRESGLVHHPFGRTLLVLAGVGEIVSIGVLAVFDVGAAAEDGGPLALIVGLVRAMAPLAATAAMGIAFRTMLWWYPSWFLRFVAAGDPQEVGVRGGLAMMFLGVLIAEAAGIEPLLGAFFAGLIVSYVLRERHVIEHKLSGIAYGFFVPAFFIHVGARMAIDVTALGGHLAPMATVALMVLLSRLPAFVALGASGRGLAASAAGALLLSAPLTLQIAVADLGARNGVFSAEDEAGIVLAAMASGLVFPALARRLLSRPT